MSAMRRIELHCHSSFSPDGWGAPEEIVRIAGEREVSLLAITDHNHFGAITPARAAALEHRVNYLSGAEFDLLVEPGGPLCHFLLLGFDPTHPGLAELARRQGAAYEASFRAMLPHFATHGITPDLPLWEEALTHRYIGNPQPRLNQWYLEEWLLHQEGEGKRMERATFRSLVAAIREQEPAAALERYFTSLQEALPLIHEAGGAIVLAHVARYFPGEGQRQLALIDALLEQGVDGFELLHPSNRGDVSFEHLQKKAQAGPWLITGGSDHHDATGLRGETTPFAATQAPKWLWERLQARFGPFAF